MKTQQAVSPDPQIEEILSDLKYFSENLPPVGNPQYYELHLNKIARVIKRLQANPYWYCISGTFDNKTIRLEHLHGEICQVRWRYVTRYGNKEYRASEAKICADKLKLLVEQKSRSPEHFLELLTSQDLTSSSSEQIACARRELMKMGMHMPEGTIWAFPHLGKVLFPYIDTSFIAHYAPELQYVTESKPDTYDRLLELAEEQFKILRLYGNPAELIGSPSYALPAWYRVLKLANPTLKLIEQFKQSARQEIRNNPELLAFIKTKPDFSRHLNRITGLPETEIAPYVEPSYPIDLKQLDNMNNLLSRGDFGWILGHSGRGKSLLATNLAIAAALNGEKVLVLHNDMDVNMAKRWVLCNLAGIKYTGFKGEVDLTTIPEYQGVVRNLAIWEIPRCVSGVTDALAKYQERNGYSPTLLIIDQLYNFLDTDPLSTFEVICKLATAVTSSDRSVWVCHQANESGDRPIGVEDFAHCKSSFDLGSFAIGIESAPKPDPCRKGINGMMDLFYLRKNEEHTEPFAQFDVQGDYYRLVRPK